MMVIELLLYTTTTRVEKTSHRDGRTKKEETLCARALFLCIYIIYISINQIKRVQNEARARKTKYSEATEKRRRRAESKGERERKECVCV